MHIYVSVKLQDNSKLWTDFILIIFKVDKLWVRQMVLILCMHSHLTHDRGPMQGSNFGPRM